MNLLFLHAQVCIIKKWKQGSTEDKQQLANCCFVNWLFQLHFTSLPPHTAFPRSPTPPTSHKVGQGRVQVPYDGFGSWRHRWGGRRHAHARDGGPKAACHAPTPGAAPGALGCYGGHQQVT